MREGKRELVLTWPLLVFAGLFIACLLTANVVSAKLVGVGGLILPAGVIVFPLSYVMGDVLAEVYGYATVRRIIWLGFACNLVMVAAIWMAGHLPPAPFWKHQAAFDEIFAQAPRILMASFVAYLGGSFLNVYVLAKLKIATDGRWLWTRTVGSTIAGQGLDSLLFVVLAYAAVVPLATLGGVILSQWLVKVAYEAAVTPVTYAVVRWLKARERIDVYDRETDFNPLRL
jgi:uncharacterized integral membrane protein (TIGR00697 family)